MYYLLRKESDPKIVGVKDASAQVEINESGYRNKENFKDLQQFFVSSNYWKRTSFAPDKNFIIEFAQVLPKAKLTDFLRYRPFLVACPFMVSDRVKTVFEKFNFPERYFFPVSIFNGKDLVSDTYSLFYTPLLGYETVNFQKSIFYTWTAKNGKTMHHFSNMNDYLSFEQMNPMVQGEVIRLNDSFNKSLDFFSLRFGGLYVSAALKDAIEMEEFTGVKVLEAKEPSIET